MRFARRCATTASYHGRRLRSDRFPCQVLETAIREGATTITSPTVGYAVTERSASSFAAGQRIRQRQGGLERALQHDSDGGGQFPVA